MHLKSVCSRFSIAFVAFFLYTITASYAVTLTTVPSLVEDGQSLTINGKDFGVHNLDINWVGGFNGNIERGRVGDKFNPGSRWVVDNDSNSATAPRYTNKRQHSYGKSIVCDPSNRDGRNILNSGFVYAHPDRFDKIYTSWWVYVDISAASFNKGSTMAQWKPFKLSPTKTYSGDVNGQLSLTHWYKSSDLNPTNGIRYIRCNTSAQKEIGGISCYPSDYKQRWLPESIRQGEWYRVEMWASGSSANRKKDGSWAVGFHRPNSRVADSWNWNNNIITRADGEQWKYMEWQNYWGNGGDFAKFYIDDVYVQIGTKARVEIGDQETWSNCKHREIQYPMNWTNSSINIRFNKGSFQSGNTVYLYVVDENGNVNSTGKAIKIGGSVSAAASGGGSSDSIPPPPSGIKIVN